MILGNLFSHVCLSICARIYMGSHISWPASLSLSLYLLWGVLPHTCGLDLLKKPGFFSCRISHSLSFADCIPLTSFRMFRCVFWKLTGLEAWSDSGFGFGLFCEFCRCYFVFPEVAQYLVVSHLMVAAAIADHRLHPWIHYSENWDILIS